MSIAIHLFIHMFIISFTYSFIHLILIYDTDLKTKRQKLEIRTLNWSWKLLYIILFFSEIMKITLVKSQLKQLGIKLVGKK